MEISWNMYLGWRSETLIQHAPELGALLDSAYHDAEALQDAKFKKLSSTAIETARKKLDDNYEKIRKFAATFQGPVYRVNPDVDLKALPRLWYEYVELEGPLAEWPTKATREFSSTAQ